ncbi:MAG: hypothetical protein ABI981_02180 [Betaproteobacteria bacterium]
MTLLNTLTATILATYVGSSALGAEPGTAADPDKPSSYAGQQQRAIKTLAESEVAALLAGDGMGFAKAAELNDYPGPAHALELIAALELSTTQVDQTRALMNQHKSRAREMGARVVAAERELNSLFASQHATADAVEAATRQIGLLQASLRAEHLKTHIAQRALLTDDQVRKYGELRGYRSEGAAGTTHPEPAGHGAGHH